MFKRITKTQKKRQLDEELGLDEEAKQMFGMHDTDSDESNSDSDSDSSDDDGALDGELDGESDANMKMEWLAAEGGGSEDEDDTDEEGLDLDGELDDEPPIPLSKAVKNPIYLVSIDTDVRACIVCPKKLLKNSKMVELHTESAAHIRRFQKFCELAETRKHHSKDPRRLAAAISQKPQAATNAEGESKRGLKRKERLELIKKKRAATKQIIERKKKERAKKEARAAKSGDASDSESDKASSERPQKRHKVSKGRHIQENGGGGGNADAGDQARKDDGEKRTEKAQNKQKRKATDDLVIFD